MNSAGKVFFHVNSSGLTTHLTKLREGAVKILIVNSTAYLVLRSYPEPFLKFYRVDLPALLRGDFKRHRILKFARIQVTELVQVDSKFGKMVTASESLFQVWDLESENGVFTGNGVYGKSIWYSRNHVVCCRDEGSQKRFIVSDLDSKVSSGVTVNGEFQVHHIEVVQGKLVIVGVNTPVAVVDLRVSKSYLATDSPAKYYFETEKLDDEFLILGNGTGKFVSKPTVEIAINCNNPLFTDTEDTLAIYDKKGLRVISKEGKLIGRVSKQLPSRVSALGMNEDTQEIYLGLKNGGVAIFQ